MLYRHFSQAPWHPERWPNFSQEEVSCRHCGEMYYDEPAFDAIQRMRDIVAKPLQINSAHRCLIHNRRVGGALNSAHKKIAFDVSINGHDPGEILDAARKAGFTGFGFYATFLHVDLGKPRTWSTKKGRAVWNSYLQSSGG